MGTTMGSIGNGVKRVMIGPSTLFVFGSGYCVHVITPAIVRCLRVGRQFVTSTYKRLHPALEIWKEFQVERTSYTLASDFRGRILYEERSSGGAFKRIHRRFLCSSAI